MCFVLLCIVCFQDVRTRKISNVLVGFIFVLGGLYGFCLDDWFGVANWIAKVLLYLVVLYPLYKIGVVGAGDVKVIAAVEGMFGWDIGFVCFAWIWVFAAVMALFKLLSQGNAVERLVYFISYVKDVAVTGNWQFYHQERKDGQNKDRTIPVSVPLLMGFALCMGG